MNKVFQSIILIYLFPIGVFCQNIILTERETIEMALKENPQMEIASLRIEKQKALKGASINFRNLELLIQSPTEKGFRPALLQTFDFPTVYVQQYKAQNNLVQIANAEKGITSNNLIYQVRHNYNFLNYLTEKNKVLIKQDSIFSNITEVNDIRYRVGQISNLEKINGESYYKQIQLSLFQNQADVKNAEIQLSIQIGKPNDTSYTFAGKLIKMVDNELNITPDTNFSANPLSKYYEQQMRYSQRLVSLERNRRLPGLMVGYLDQWDAPLRYHVSFGLTIPIWYWAYHSRIKASKKDVEIVSNQAQYNSYQLKGEFSKEMSNFTNYKKALEYFENVGLAQSDEILKSARESYRLGSIGYYIYLLNINQSFQIQYNYLEALKNYNQSIIVLQYLTGDQKY